MRVAPLICILLVGCLSADNAPPTTEPPVGTEPEADAFTLSSITSFECPIMQTGSADCDQNLLERSAPPFPEDWTCTDETSGSSGLATFWTDGEQVGIRIDYAESLQPEQILVVLFHGERHFMLAGTPSFLVLDTTLDELDEHEEGLVDGYGVAWSTSVEALKVDWEPTVYPVGDWDAIAAWEGEVNNSKAWFVQSIYRPNGSQENRWGAYWPVDHRITATGNESLWFHMHQTFPAYAKDFVMYTRPPELLDEEPCPSFAESPLLWNGPTAKRRG